MTYTSLPQREKTISDREIELYFDAFQEEASKLIASGLLSLPCKGDKLVFHEIPNTEKFATVLQLYDQDTKTATIDEFADYRDLPDLTPKTIVAEIKALALQFADSYLSNVKNAYIKNGRLRNFNEKLHVTYWKSALKVNVVANDFALSLEPTTPGWCAFRYRFAAVKI